MKLKLNYEEPFSQLAFLGLACLLVQLCALALLMQGEDPYGESIWIISATFLLLFAFLNATMQLKTANLQRYLTRSLYGFILMVLLTAGLAWGLTVGQESPTDMMRSIYMVILLCYVIFLVIVFLMRKIMDYAQRQDQEFNP
ncbi:MAG: hypothetical protein KTR24_02680 [Saprospiraceae bacterium]|nr:hypothetical protein [Saprospiraceae bacterium]